MDVSLFEDNQRFLDEGVARGRFLNHSAAVDEAVGLLRRREELIEEVNRGIAELNGGVAVEYSEVEFERFLADIRALSSRMASRRKSD